MKKLVFLLALLTLCSCQKQEETTRVVVTTEPPSTAVLRLNIDFEDVNWEDLSFWNSVDKVCNYNDTEKNAMASACAKGVQNKTNCTYEQAWNASYDIVCKLVEKANTLKSLYTLGVATWSASDKEQAVILTSDYIDIVREIDGYISLSGTTIDNEILNALQTTVPVEELPETTEETTIEITTQPPVIEEPPVIEIDWGDEAMIESIKTFSEYDNEMLDKVKSMYAEGYSIETGYPQDAIRYEIDTIVNKAKENADSGMLLYELRESWTTEIKATAEKTVSDFLLFVEDFKKYVAIVEEYKQLQAIITTN